MIQALAIALTIAAAYGHPTQRGSDAYVIASAIVDACDGDISCVEDAVVFAQHESGMSLHPKAFSHDARSGLSRGPLQVQGAGNDLDAQAERWVALRAWSLQQCGSLSALASGSCTRGTRLAASRAAEVDSLHWAIGSGMLSP
jgi:hypothetical protein